jgi:HlyD family secretion protein
VEIDVLSSDAVRIQPGGRVLFEYWGGPQPLEGRVRMVEPAGFLKISALGVEEQRVWVIADFTSPPAEWQSLGDAYRVEARIITWESSNTLKVPSGALFRRQNAWAVFKVVSGRADLEAVEVGHRGENEAEILSGLAEGERVILHPSDRVGDGVRVKERE